MPSLPADPAFVFGGGGGNGNVDNIASNATASRMFKTGAINTELNKLKSIRKCVDDSVSKFSSSDKLTEMANEGYLRLDTNADTFIGIIRKGCFVEGFGQTTNMQISYLEGEIEKSINNRKSNIENALNNVNITSKAYGQLKYCVKDIGKCLEDLGNKILDWIKSNWKEILGFGVTVGFDVICTGAAGAGTAVAAVPTGGAAVATIGFSVSSCLAAGAAFGAAVKQIINTSEGKPFNFGEMAQDTAINYIGGVLFKFVGEKVVVPVVVKGKNYLVANFGKNKTVLREAASAGDNLCIGSGKCNWVDDVCNCFVAGTLVSVIIDTKTGLVVNTKDLEIGKIESDDGAIKRMIELGVYKDYKIPIEQLVEGDYVVTKNVMDENNLIERKNSQEYLGVEYKPIVRTIKQVKEQMAKVKVRNIENDIIEILETTKDHEWIVFGNRLTDKYDDKLKLLDHVEKRTFELKVGDRLINKYNQEIVVEDVKLYNNATFTYNFTIQDNHNYLVGVGGVLVHNSCILPGHPIYDLTSNNSKPTHLLSGNATGGFHHVPSAGLNTKVVEVIKKGDNGIYEALVEINGVLKSTNGGKSTMFPNDWTDLEVLNAIIEAYNNKLGLIPGSSNSYVGKSRGIDIEIFINNDGKIISAFPAKVRTFPNGLEIRYNGFK